MNPVSPSQAAGANTPEDNKIEAMAGSQETQDKNVETMAGAQDTTMQTMPGSQDATREATPKTVLVFDYCKMPLRIEVKTSPIHGLGLFAVEFIPKSCIILTERDLFQLSILRPRWYSQDIINNVMEGLSEKDRAGFNTLYGEATSDGAVEVLDTFLTNAFVCNASPTHERRGLYLASSRANHSHAPNATTTLLTLGENQNMVLTAARNILKGQEVTIPYCCLRKPTAGLETGFLCHCGDCPSDNTSSYIDVYGTGPQDECLCLWCQAHPRGDSTPVSREINGAAARTERDRENEFKEMIESTIGNLDRTSLGGADPVNAAAEVNNHDSDFESAFMDEDNNNYQEGNDEYQEEEKQEGEKQEEEKQEGEKQEGEKQEGDEEGDNQMTTISVSLT